MKGLAFAVPGDLATPTGGYAYDRRIIAELKTLGWTIDVIDLGEGYPRPDATALLSCASWRHCAYRRACAKSNLSNIIRIKPLN